MPAGTRLLGNTVGPLLLMLKVFGKRIGPWSFSFSLNIFFLLQVVANKNELAFDAINLFEQSSDNPSDTSVKTSVVRPVP